MNLKVIESNSAVSDLDSLDDYFNENAGQSVAIRFVKATQRAYELLASMPGIGVSRDYGRSELKGMRMLAVPEFANYLIFYRFSEIEIEILRVFHGAQNIEEIFINDEVVEDR